MSDASTPSPNPNLQALTDNGVAIWLDDLSRERLETGNLAKLVRTKNVTGVTTNPSIFQAALSKGERYDAQLRELAAAGTDVADTLFELTTDDVRAACDVLMPVYRESGGVDGRVSIEVEPSLAANGDGTVVSAKKLFDKVDRENVLIKIPATPQGLSAISQVLAEGISVNVTLIFSLDRYRAVMNAFLTGLEQARENGKDLSTIHSVASFFVSRVDAEIDKRLDAIGTDEAKALRGKAGLANARLAYQAWQETFATPRWANLADDGANVQRPLWASTGVKDPAYKDTLYVDELVAPQTVNTMPEKTLDAVADHGDIHGDAVTGTYEESAQVLDALERLGISFEEVTEKLEKEGVEKFVAAWTELTETTQGQLDQAR